MFRFFLVLSAAIWHQRWQSVEGSCSVWGEMSPSRLLRSAAWRKACIAWKTSLRARPTWVCYTVSVLLLVSNLLMLPLLALLTFSFLFLPAHPSGGSGGGTPSLWGRQAQLCPAGPDPAGAASGGAGRVGWHFGATARTQRCSTKNPNHRRWAADLSWETDCPT